MIKRANAFYEPLVWLVDVLVIDVKRNDKLTAWLTWNLRWINNKCQAITWSELQLICEKKTDKMLWPQT